jgi:hypothetical protein
MVRAASESQRDGVFGEQGRTLTTSKPDRVTVLAKMTSSSKISLDQRSAHVKWSAVKIYHAWELPGNHLIPFASLRREHVFSRIRELMVTFMNVLVTELSNCDRMTGWLSRILQRRCIQSIREASVAPTNMQRRCLLQ